MSASPVATKTLAAPKPTGIGRYWAIYLKLLDKFPVRTKALTSALTSVVADLIAQRLIGAPYNIAATLRQTFIGFCIRGPVVHYWYQILTQLFANFDQTAFSTAVGKMVVDQTVFSPFFLAVYFVVNGLLNGKSFAEIQAQMVAEYSTVIRANWKIWPIVNLINFRFVPPQLRVLFGNLAGVLWTVILISLTTKAAPAAIVAPATSAKQ